VTGGWRILHNEELHNLYPTQISDIIRRLRWAGHVAHVGKMGHAHTVVIGKPERNWV
jgi:hypothetical protein